MDRNETNPMIDGLIKLVGICLVVTGQVIVFGGMWAAWTGGDLWFWRFAESGPSGGAVVAILVIGEPVIMAIAYVVFMLVAVVLSALGAGLSALGSSRRRRSP